MSTIVNPLNVLAPTAYISNQNGSGLIILLNNLVKAAIVIAGIYAFLNLMISGYMFLNAGGDPKNITKAWEKIWQSLIGLLLVASSFILAMVFGYLIFGDITALINPRIYHP
jgi:hypothetical protein